MRIDAMCIGSKIIILQLKTLLKPILTSPILFKSMQLRRIYQEIIDKWQAINLMSQHRQSRAQKLIWPVLKLIRTKFESLKLSSLWWPASVIVRVSALPFQAISVAARRDENKADLQMATTDRTWYIQKYTMISAHVIRNELFVAALSNGTTLLKILIAAVPRIYF